MFLAQRGVWPVVGEDFGWHATVVGLVRRVDAPGAKGRGYSSAATHALSADNLVEIQVDYDLNPVGNPVRERFVALRSGWRDGQREASLERKSLRAGAGVESSW